MEYMLIAEVTRTKWFWTKWYGQNGGNFYRFQFNWIEFLFSNHKS